MVRERKEYTFLWFIENYSYCWHQNGKALISPAFTADGLEDTSWTLRLYPRGIGSDNKSHISLYLDRSLSDAGPESILVESELSFLLSGENSVSSSLSDVSFKQGEGHGFREFFSLSQVHMQTHDQDILTVRCKIWKGVGSIQKIPPKIARTRVGIESISFLHTIEDFASLQPYQKHTVKVPFNSRNECFALSSVQYTRHGTILIQIISSDDSHVLSNGTISLISNRNTISCGQADIRLPSTRKEIEYVALCIKRNSILAREDHLLQDGKLSLLCKVVFSTGLEFSKIEETRREIFRSSVSLKRKIHKSAEQSDYYSIIKAMTSLYLNQFLTDVELRTKTGSFLAHKIVLCARSPVFVAMLTSDELDKKTNLVQIADLEDNILQQFLYFLYTDTIENLNWETAPHLYYAADKYQVDALKEACVSYMTENLTPPRAAELLLMADTHSDNDFKLVVEDFILEYREEVYASTEWQKLLESHPSLVMNAMLCSSTSDLRIL